MMSPPTGTVTFLFTDIEGSTRLWEERPDAMRAALAEHDALLRAAIDAHGGYVFSTGGDGFAAAFSRAADAIDAARKAQVVLADHPLIKVRMGIHTGEVQERDGDYFGPAVNRAARTMAVGHGGQVLMSQTTAAIVDRAGLVDLGEHKLRDLSAPTRLFQLGDRSFSPLRSVELFATNLASQLSEFIGRTNELAELSGLLRQHRLITLTGPGGTGKTRLALQAAADALPRFADGVWVVELAGVADPAEVPATFAAALDIQQRAGQTMTESIVGVLFDRNSLVVLDNCEHVIDSAADLVSAVLAGCSDVVVLATSREGIGIAGERIVAVRPLDLPDGASGAETVDAVRLFCDRAQAASAAFELNEANISHVVELCRRLDGLPLALELAASRMGVMTAGDVLEHFDDRFRLLAAGRGARRRHQTLQAAIDWSYDLLDESQQALLCRLAVFAGGFRADSAAAVCGSDGDDASQQLDALLRLVAKSLVVADTAGPKARYRLLETIREYGWSRLSSHERAHLQGVHATHMVELAELLDAGVRTPDEAAWIRRLREELDNIRVAFAHLEENSQIDDAARLAVALFWAGSFRGGYGILGYADRCLDLLGDRDHPLRSRLLVAAGMRAMMSDDTAKAAAFADQVDESEQEAPPTLHFLRANIAALVATLQDSCSHLEAFARAGEATHDSAIAAHGRGFMAMILVALGDDAEATAQVAAVRTHAQQLGNPTARVAALYGEVYQRGLGLDQYADGLAAAESARELAREVDNQSFLIYLAQVVAQIHLQRGDHDGLILSVLEACARYGQPSFRRFDLLWVVPSLQHHGMNELCAIIGGFLQKVTIHVPRLDPVLDEALDRARSELTSSEFERLAQRGRQSTLDELASEVRSTLARISARTGRTT